MARQSSVIWAWRVNFNPIRRRFQQNVVLDQSVGKYETKKKKLIKFMFLYFFFFTIGTGIIISIGFSSKRNRWQRRHTATIDKTSRSVRIRLFDILHVDRRPSSVWRAARPSIARCSSLFCHISVILFTFKLIFNCFFFQQGRFDLSPLRDKKHGVSAAHRGEARALVTSLCAASPSHRPQVLQEKKLKISIFYAFSLFQNYRLLLLENILCFGQQQLDWHLFEMLQIEFVLF